MNIDRVMKSLVLFIILLGSTYNVEGYDSKFYKDTNLNNECTSINLEDKNHKENNNKKDQQIINSSSDCEIIYKSYKEDMFADNAKDIQLMLKRWNYLREDGKKIAYLTFDDGPSTRVTTQILKILNKNNIKATFFVLGSVVEKSDEAKMILRQMVREGHAIGNHGYCHNYKVLYPARVADPVVLVEDMNKSEQVLKSVLGKNFSTKVIRMPGGHMSWKTKELDPVLEANGLTYIDWNALNGDAEGQTKTTEQLINRFKGSVQDLSGNDDVLVILMHDTNAKQTTVQSLQDIIDYLKSLGYEFRTLK